MAARRSSRKFFWLGLVLIFLTGLFGGAYLVLKSATTQGELANSTPLAEGKSSDELLEELLKLNQQESTEAYIPPEDKNLTEDFLKTIVDKSSGPTINPKQIASDDFFVSTILPYLKGNQINIFPEIPDSALKIVGDSKANSQKYFKDTNKDMVVFFNDVRKIMKLGNLDENEDLSASPQITDLAQSLPELASAFENLARVSVPQSKAELHKKILISVFSLHKMMEALTGSEDDPLKSLLITNEAEAMGGLWQETLYDYVDYPVSKRK